MESIEEMLPEGSRWELVEKGRSYITQWMPDFRQSIIVGNALSMVADEAAKQSAILALEKAERALREAGYLTGVNLVIKLREEYKALDTGMEGVQVDDR